MKKVKITGNLEGNLYNITTQLQKFLVPVQQRKKVHRRMNHSAIFTAPYLQRQHIQIYTNC